MLDVATIDTVREFKSRLARRYPERLKAVYLFGSQARGDARPDSDIDVAVILAGPIKHPFALEREINIDAFDLLLERGAHIQPWVIEEGSLEAPESHRDPHLSRSIIREGVPV